MSNASFSDSSEGETGTLTIHDAAGAAVTPAVPPTWVTDDNGSIVVLTVAADGLSATAAPVSPPVEGTANITITVTDSAGTVLTLATSVTVTVGPEATVTVDWEPIVPVPPVTPTP